MVENEATAALVAAARRGDGGALDRLYRRFAPVVHGILLGYAAHADAEDLAQRVFETAFRRLADLREDAAFPGWNTGCSGRMISGPMSDDWTARNRWSSAAT